MRETSSTVGPPFRGHHRLVLLAVAVLLILTVIGSRGGGEARLVSTYNLVPTCFLRASITIAEIARDFGESISQVYWYTALSASTVSQIKRALDQSKKQSIATTDKSTEKPNPLRHSRWNAQRAAMALQRIPQKLVSSITSLFEKGVSSVVGIHQPTHTITLGSVYAAALRTVEQVQPPSSMGTA